MSADSSKLGRALRWIDGQAASASFLPKVAVFPLLDYAVPVLPNQMLLVALSFLQRARWLAIALTFVVASALGAGAIAVLVQTIGGGIAEWLTRNAESSGRVFDFVRDYGVWALGLLALLPAPPRTAVFLCALAGLSPVSIALAVGAGRSVPATLIAWAAARAPDWLRRLPGMTARLDRLEALRT